LQGSFFLIPLPFDNIWRMEMEILDHEFNFETKNEIEYGVVH